MGQCAAHEAGIAAVRGITPTYAVQIRTDMLAEVDGPLFEHGIKGLHGRQLMSVPRRRADRPDKDLLATRYEEFRAA